MAAGAAYARNAPPNEPSNSPRGWAQALGRDPYPALSISLRGIVGADQIL